MENFFGLLGGYYIIFIGFLRLTLGDYQHYKLNTSLLTSFYSEDKEGIPDDDLSVRHACEETLVHRKKYIYNYCSYMLARMACLCK